MRESYSQNSMWLSNAQLGQQTLVICLFKHRVSNWLSKWLSKLLNSPQRRNSLFGSPIALKVPIPERWKLVVVWDSYYEVTVEPIVIDHNPHDPLNGSMKTLHWRVNFLINLWFGLWFSNGLTQTKTVWVFCLKTKRTLLPQVQSDFSKRSDFAGGEINWPSLVINLGNQIKQLATIKFLF